MQCKLAGWRLDLHSVLTHPTSPYRPHAAEASQSIRPIRLEEVRGMLTDFSVPIRSTSSNADLDSGTQVRHGDDASRLISIRRDQIMRPISETPVAAPTARVARAVMSAF